MAAAIAFSNTGQACHAGTRLLVPASRLGESKLLLVSAISSMHDEPKAPFGGFKNSGIGRDHGTYGIEEYLEPKVILGHSSVM
ncbi:hypothetical protein KCTCHS21_27370 [Cohnella abietis]|uniref:Aldehyde dehydrogenase domain-containing protein n=1 Tax=Cohnella abietis TaxID=2507935 RepID=A0A3T1D5M5_9BACL|nr:hypothetical protein KCTCHS21_27370 [Cohnella abietis]